MASTPLAVLDLVPIPAGSTAAQALRNSIDLARQAERFGYARYWFAEHHLSPGVASTSPAVMLALTAPATSTIRLGSGAVLLGHRTALSVVEEFGLIDALYPGRLDLGIGRSDSGSGKAGGTGQPAPPPGPPNPPGPPPAAGGRAPNGLKIPARFAADRLRDSPHFRLQRELLRQPGAQPPDYGDQVADILALLDGTFRPPLRVVPGQGAAVQVWVLGSSGGASARAAGAHGLRFAANYHVSPATVLEAVAGYRAAFRPSAELAKPYVSVSADVVVADDEQAARAAAEGYALWVRSIRSGQGAIEFPAPEQARAHRWSDADRQLVADRLETQFVGTARQVAERLRQLRDANEADELIITTITHDHAARVRSYELLAGEWMS